MLITTTPYVEGHPITRYIGPVQASAMLRMDSVEVWRIFSNDELEKDMRLNQELDVVSSRAVAILEDKAAALGANAIIGTSFDSEVATSEQFTDQWVITWTGTAVVIQ